MAQNINLTIDPKNGFYRSNSTFYSKRNTIPLPINDSLDVTTFISVQVHHGKVVFIDAATSRHLTFSEFWKAVDYIAMRSDPCCLDGVQKLSRKAKLVAITEKGERGDLTMVHLPSWEGRNQQCDCCSPQPRKGANLLVF
ncbi:hypothetical protein PTKIN_Ptkin18bG0044200 [Pterospermum kingtungense]